jgi:two-component system, NtrC family, sensor histidine kinase PilS
VSSKQNLKASSAFDADLSVMPDFRPQASAAPRSVWDWWRDFIQPRGDWFPNAQLNYFVRALRSVAGARCLLVLGAIAIEAYSVLVIHNAPQPLWPIGLVYAVFSIALLIFAYWQPRGRVLQASVGLCVDWLASIGVFVIAGMGTGAVVPGNALLLAWPVLQAGVLGSGYLALLVALAQACYLSVHAMGYAAGIVTGETVPVMYAVLVSLGLVAVGWLSQQLASRLNAQEAEREQAEQRAKRQEAVNRLSLAELDDGVFVADLQGRIETANPAALNMLGLIERALPTLLTSRADLLPLAEAFTVAIHTGTELDQRVVWKRRGLEHVALVQCRVTQAAGQDAVVVFMRDAHRIAQQVHEAKLAGMGRLVAGIAHDIRNPLSAITQAAQLLKEQHHDAQVSSAGNTGAISTGEKLSGMILTHAERINETIEDVLILGRKPRVADKATEIAVWLQDWAEEQRNLGRAGPLRLNLEAAVSAEPGPLFSAYVNTGSTVQPQLSVRFHHDHLRRIINNLYDNALRYCSGAAGSIDIVLQVLNDEHAVDVVVANDGPAIQEPLRSQLFEPFMSGESRGTGLGLYICRELCQQNNASLRYRLSAASDRLGEFVIRMPLGYVAQG